MGSGPSGGDLAPELAETHSGVVVFLGDRAYKLKKPLDLGFLDFSTLEARRAACHREVELNRRLAPDVYLGVADVIGPDGRPCEHLVVMRRMPAGRRLSTLVTEGADVDLHLVRLARLMAAFHAAAERSPQADEAAGVEATLARWATNTAEMEPFTGRTLDAAAVAEVDALARRYLAGRGPVLARRVADGRACDGHGDLLAGDVFCLDDGPRVLDCIEFDDRLRLGDGLADVAFLAMDLEGLGRPDLAARFLSAYREHSGDNWPDSLAHHHVAYRAQVRAKVAAIRADQGHPPSAGEARSRLDLALGHLRAARVRLVLVGGLPGTGKSTLAAGLGEALGAAVLRSDVVRKELAGVAPGRSAAAPFGEGIYSPEHTQATYHELLRRARLALGMGEAVVLDASWADPAIRVEARRVAEETFSDLAEIVCVTPPTVAGARMRRRAGAAHDPSDADVEVAAAMARSFAPWPEAAEVDTTGRPGDSLARARDLLTP